MLRTTTISIIAAAAVAATNPAQAQTSYYGSYINQPRGYGPPAYAPQPTNTAPTYARPRVTVTPPAYGRGSGAYWDYRHFGDPSTRDSLDTCAYC